MGRMKHCFIISVFCLNFIGCTGKATTDVPPDPDEGIQYVLRLDMNSAEHDDTYEGYTGFTPAVYSDETGYGWDSLTGLSGYYDTELDYTTSTETHFDYNGREAIFRDAHYGSAGREFMAKLDPGYYKVRLMFAIINAIHPPYEWLSDIQVEGTTLEGTALIMRNSVYAGDHDKVFTFSIQVTDGILNIRFLDSTLLNGIEIQKLDNPLIDSSAADITHGQTVNITGDNFGIKDPASPLYWLDFEGHDNLDPINYTGWTIHRMLGPETDPHFWSGNSYSGSFSGRSYWSNTDGGGGDNGIYTAIEDFTELYASHRYYIRTISGIGPNNIKLMRFVSGIESTADPVHGAPYQSFNLNRYDGILLMHRCEQLDIAGQGDHSPSFGEWHRGDIYIKESSLGGFDGTNAVWYDEKNLLFNDRFMNDDCVDADHKNLLLPFYYRDQSETDGTTDPYEFEILYDDVYVDTTRMRVEICDSDDWLSRTHCEIQYPLSWDNEEIQYRVNQGTFLDGENAYLYVIDSEGSVNDPGYPVSF